MFNLLNDALPLDEEAMAGALLTYHRLSAVSVASCLTAQIPAGTDSASPRPAVSWRQAVYNIPQRAAEPPESFPDPPAPTGNTDRRLPSRQTTLPVARRLDTTESRCQLSDCGSGNWG